MSNVIAVRNWSHYQHYKDRDPPWVKLYRDLLSTESWVLGTDASRLVQIAIILLAARYSNQIPLQWNLVRKVASLDCSEEQFNKAIAHLASTNFLEIQSVTETGNAVVQDASKALASCTSETEQRQSRADSTGAARPSPPEFDELKTIFPRRAGSQPWPDALKAIKARLREGHTWQEILDGAKRYAAYVRSAGIEGSEHVLQAKTFCGPSKRFTEVFMSQVQQARPYL